MVTCVDYGTSNAARCHSIAGAASLYLPNFNWSLFVIHNMNSTASFPYFFSYGGNYGAAGSIQMYNNGASGFTVKVDTLADRASGLAPATSRWMIGCAVRNGTSLTARSMFLDDVSTYSISASTSISTGYAPSGDIKIGLRSDLTSNSTYAFNGLISDIVFLKGYAMTEADMKDIANGAPWSRARWGGNIVLNARMATSANKYLYGEIGDHLIVRNGTGYATDKNGPVHVNRKGQEANIPVLLTAAPAATSLPVFHNHFASQGIV